MAASATRVSRSAAAPELASARRKVHAMQARPLDTLLLIDTSPIRLHSTIHSGRISANFWLGTWSTATWTHPVPGLTADRFSRILKRCRLALAACHLYS